MARNSRNLLKFYDLLSKSLIFCLNVRNIFNPLCQKKKKGIDDGGWIQHIAIQEASVGLVKWKVCFSTLINDAFHFDHLIALFTFFDLATCSPSALHQKMILFNKTEFGYYNIYRKNEFGDLARLSSIQKGFQLNFTR